MATIAPATTSTGLSNPSPATRRRRGRPRLADRQLAGSAEEPLARRRLYTRLSQRAWRDRQRQKLASQEAIITDIRAAVLRLERLAVQNKVVEKMPRFATEVFRCVSLVRSVDTGVGSGSGIGSANASGSEKSSGTAGWTEAGSIASMVPDQLVHLAMYPGADSVRAGVADGGNTARASLDEGTMQSEHGLTYEEVGQDIVEGVDFQPLLRHGHAAHAHRLTSAAGPREEEVPAPMKLSSSTVLRVCISLIKTHSALPPPAILPSFYHSHPRNPLDHKLNSPPCHQSPHQQTPSTSSGGGVSFPLTTTITPLWTYSIHETSFSRRLHRSCIEHCYRLLSSHSTRRAELLRTLKFPLAAHLSIDELRRRARELLLRGTDQSLHYQEALHDNAGISWAMRRIVSSSRRPLRSLLVSRPPLDDGDLGGGVLLEGDDAPSTTVSEIHVSGYEGTWLGPDAVAMYLQSLGMPIQDKPSSMTVPWLVSSDALENMVLRGFMKKTPPPTIPELQQPTQPRFRRPHMVVVNMDLDLMVDTLTQRAVCVDTPVFRKDDVDSIVVDALGSWYWSAYGGEEGPE
ncbi:hypothetical protein AYL99_03165 [Fonsecaea erecta]|uniref:Uncharacterized protein n=1 Tax=Fonsecaea erecta TaxID=1367422 RepID=A0A178ZVW9_9EURO|nr:hypothetical protein AYL99_03165 [Fonsecaea erecta]OAP63938.1 hypothetical protein AYL99_03165 [Fonsecaea erecta]